MTDEERALTLAAIDAAYTAQISKLFAVLCSAPEVEIELAGNRFEAGMRRALHSRELAMECTNDVGIE